MVPLSGLHNRLVGGVYALAQRKRSVRPSASSVSRSFFFAMPRNSSDRITPELPRGWQREAVASTRFGGVGSASFFHLSHCGTHRHGHIRAGIAVRYREYVQFVCLFLLFCNGRCALDHHGPVQRTVDFLICHLSNSLKVTAQLRVIKISVCLQTVTV